MMQILRAIFSHVYERYFYFLFFSFITLVYFNFCCILIDLRYILDFDFLSIWLFKKQQKLMFLEEANALNGPDSRSPLSIPTPFPIKSN